jgi:hypothetical protein
MPRVVQADMRAALLPGLYAILRGRCRNFSCAALSARVFPRSQWHRALVWLQILLGNKADTSGQLVTQRRVSTERGEKLAGQCGIRFYETSAKASPHSLHFGLALCPSPTLPHPSPPFPTLSHPSSPFAFFACAILAPVSRFQCVDAPLPHPAPPHRPLGAGACFELERRPLPIPHHLRGRRAHAPRSRSEPCHADPFPTLPVVLPPAA